VSCKEYEFKAFDVNETKKVIPEKAAAIGEVGGFIQISISHFGKSHDSSQSGSIDPMSTSTKHFVDNSMTNTSQYRPKVCVRAGFLSHDHREVEHRKSNGDLTKESDLSLSNDDLQALFKQFPGEKKGLLRYDGKFLSLIGVTSVKRLYQKLLMVICKYDEGMIDKVSHISD
jgi:hypothetical protein